jgi:hypothetical protein
VRLIFKEIEKVCNECNCVEDECIAIAKKLLKDKIRTNIAGD